MASINGIFQPVVPLGATHVDEIKNVLKYKNGVVLASAFVKESGIDCIFDELKKIGRGASFYVGVRNNITSVQALIKILDTGCELYVVDTGTVSRIFHGKIYAGHDDKAANVVIGSANSTFNGLNNNLEIGANILLDLNVKADKEYLDSILNYFEVLKKDHSGNCYKIKSAGDCKELLNDGLVLDERVTSRSIVQGTSLNKTLKSSSIAVPMVHPPKKVATKKSAAKKKEKSSQPTISAAPSTVIVSGRLLWTKKELSRRDMQLVKGNASGNVCLTQAGFKVNGNLIDWKTYFRKDVFSRLSWKEEKDKETSQAKFSLVIDGVNFGVYDLTISHKPSWEAGQSNYTTAIHWGDVTPLIVKEELVGKKLHLFECEAKDIDYVLEITD